MNSNYGTASTVSAQPATQLEGVVNRLDSVHEKIATIASRLMQHADKLDGGKLEKAIDPSPPRCVPNGLVGNIFEKIDNIEATIAAAYGHLDRLQSIV